MATYFRLLDPMRQFLDGNGAPYSGGKLQTYTAGTTTNKATYQDGGGLALHTNPIILDSAGRIPYEVWGTTGAYDLVLSTSADVVIDTAEDIDGINDISENAASEWVASELTPTYVDADTFTLVGNHTTIFHYGRRLRLTDATTLYGFVASSSYSDPNTTVNIIADSGSLSASLSAVSYGLISVSNSSAPSFARQTVASVTLSANHNQTAAANTFEAIPLNTEAIDTGGLFASNGFTTPIAGVYAISGLVATASGLGTDQYIEAGIALNSSVSVYGSKVRDPSSGFTGASVVYGVLSLAAGVVIKLYGRTEAASGLVYLSGATGCRLMVARIG